MSEEEVKEEKKKGNKGLIIAVIGILVLLIVAVVILVFIFLGGKEQPPAEGGESTHQAPKEAPAHANARSDFAKMGPVFVIPEPFVVNLMGQSGRRYLKASVALELSAPEFQKEVTAKLVLIKDRISQILASKTFEEISTPKGRDKLKEEILQELNSYMVDGYFKSVLFTEFVIQ
ncbi:flagellar basal body-associated FliL family protein [Helicobacter brantae]|uniref:Flagellar protein FliL n=1 Tax=Helicobacter brantae TaxID=375927 RepID=A0A3D8IUA6_9HELI|nr:flagellar basal body-associated FliL family protein [Helicobacter brantae]RDU68867.1 flagellar basal body-associated protein FliL [Helicobacter brantae]